MIKARAHQGYIVHQLDQDKPDLGPGRMVFWGRRALCGFLARSGWRYIPEGQELLHQYNCPKCFK